MNITTLSNFKARINDIEFNNEQDFNSVSFLLENIEERFNISITDSDFTKDVKDFVELASIKVDNFSYSELENATVESIMNATKLSDIQFLANEYDDDFEFLYPKDNIYDTDVNQIVPSVFEKKTTIKLGFWESCEELYNGGTEALHKAFISRGESIYNDDALESNPELNKRYIPLDRESYSYRKFLIELDTYLETNDKGYYVDLNTGSIKMI